MNKQLVKLLTVLLYFSLLTGTVAFTKAENPIGLPNQSASARQTDPPILFSQLITSDIELVGPFASDSIVFSMPANWNLTNGGQVNLSMSLAFNAPVQGVPIAAQFSAGKLLVEFNDVIIGIVSFNHVGEISQQFQIPNDAFRSTRDDGLFELRFSLDSGWNCDFDESTFLSIHTNSSMLFSYETITPVVDLAKFPAPIYQQGSFFKESALVIIPDQPTAAELQSALTVAAGLKNLTSGKLKIDLNSVSHLTTEQIAGNHLILVGRAATNPLSSELDLPMPISSGQFEDSDGKPDDGIVEMVNSPWSEDKVILIVSGNTDAGTIKAAQAVSSGVLRPNASPNLAIIEQVESMPIPVVSSTDQTLKELGYKNEELTDIGVNYSDFVFYVPTGQTVAEDAFFDLLYGHSALLEFERSGIVIRLNGKPIGSIAFTEQSAQEAVNRVQFKIPSSVILTGQNVLEVRTNLAPMDKCSDPNFSAVYGNIWSDSILHLPLTRAVINPMVNYTLKAYPIPFAYSPTLDATAFVLQRDDLESWRAAFNVAGYLGDRAGGALFTPAAFYGDELPDTERSKYNFIVIGRPSQLPIVGEINDLLPAPFANNSDMAVEPHMQVDYRLSPQATVGYVEMLLSPWNNDNVILIAVGNTAQAVVWAASRLIEPQSYQLGGNFAIIDDQQVYTADTRLTTITPNVISTDEGVPIVDIVPSVPNLNTPISYRPAWLLPVIIISLALIFLTILAVAYSGWSRGRFKEKVKPSKE